MAELARDGFSHYGDDAVGQSNMLDGIWAQLDAECRPEVPSFGARTGTHALRIASASGTNVARRVLPSAQTTIRARFALYRAALPEANGTQHIIQWRDGTNAVLYYLTLESTGVMSLRDSGGTVVVATAGPVVTAAAWNFIETLLVINAATGQFQLWVNEENQINSTGLNTGSTAVAQWSHSISNAVSDTVDFWIDDLVLWNDTGSYNTGYSGDTRVYTLFPNSDGADQGWTASKRAKFGTGILFLDGNLDGVFADDDATFELGSGDYTLEGFIRFQDLPTGSEKATIFAKWTEAGNLRSYELFKGGPSLDSGHLVFRISTDGTAGTVTNIISYPWDAEADQWYHIALERDSGTTTAYIDGVALGLGQADANTYYDGGSDVTLGCLPTGTGSGKVPGTEFFGFMDEIRWTKGVVRYGGEFTPPSAKFPRSVGEGDSNFASVSLLSGFDASVSDESSNAHPLTAAGGAVRQTPDDGDANYQTINQTAPRDDTFIEAALVHATATLTITANPSNTETVTIGATTYAFVNALSFANDVLIGADAEESLDNLVAAVNGAAGEGSTYGTGTTANASATAADLPELQVLFTAITGGTAGNSIASTDTLANGSFPDTTFSGGADIPNHSEFGFQSLPPQVTGVRSATIVNRGFKSDSGSCEVTVSFVTASGDASAGAARPMTTAPTYREDTFEEDPSTTSALTPNSIVGARARIDRTT